jgi:hypothetical protein
MFNPYSNPSVIVRNGEMKDYRRVLPSGEKYSYELVKTSNYKYEAKEKGPGGLYKISGNLSILKDSIGDLLLSIQIQIYKSVRKIGDEFTIMYTIDSKANIDLDVIWDKIRYYTNLDYNSILAFLNFELNEYLKIKSVDGYGHKESEIDYQDKLCSLFNGAKKPSGSEV